MICIIFTTMTIEASLTRLRQLASALPRRGCHWEECPRFDPPPSTEEIEAAQFAYDGRLPDDLLAFLRLCGGVVGVSIHNGCWLSGAADLAAERFRRSFPATVTGPNGAEPVVPIATDGGGNAFLLSTPISGVWRWDHETGATHQVAISFAKFLERVIADWEAYITATPGWQFLV
jgi:SMI1 / KNR4 family (SUKH-1)